MLRDRCLATTFHTITDGDADGRCLELSGVISPSEVTTHHNAEEGEGQLFDFTAQLHISGSPADIATNLSANLLTNSTKYGNVIRQIYL